MKIEVIAIGKMSNKEQKSIIDDYAKRLRNITIIEIPVKNNYTNNPDLTKKYELEQILKYTKNKTIVCMSEEGEQFSSPEFAKFIKNTLERQQKSIAFVIGGAFGLNQKIKKNCSKVISLGKMTFPHMLARILLVEQIYRADTLMKGHPYHK